MRPPRFLRLNLLVATSAIATAAAAALAGNLLAGLAIAGVLLGLVLGWERYVVRTIDRRERCGQQPE